MAVGYQAMVEKGSQSTDQSDLSQAFAAGRAKRKAKKRKAEEAKRRANTAALNQMIAGSNSGGAGV